MQFGPARKVLFYEHGFRYYWDTVQQFITDTHQRFTLSNTDYQGQESSVSDIQKLWLIPKEERAKHLNRFLHAYSELPIFSEWRRTDSIMKLADWLDETVAASRPRFPPETILPPSVTPGSIPNPLPAHEESRLLEQISTLLELGQQDKATSLLAELVAHDTLRWEVYETLGQLYAEQNNLAEAAQVLLKGAALEFSSTHCLRKLAAVFVMQGETWRTLAACAQILKREPDDQELLLFIRDVLVSTSPRFDDISWLAPEWTGAMDALANYKGQAQAARSLLENLQAKAQAVLEEHHPLKRLGNRTLSREQDSVHDLDT